MISEIYLSLLEISILILFATLARSITIKYKLPQVLGELIVGLIISPYLFGGIINGIIKINLFSINDYLLLFSDFSVILLIFSAGLESGISTIRSTGIWGAMGATFGALVPFIAGSFILLFFVKSSVAFVMGAALGATSLAIASSLIKESNLKGKGVDFILTAGAFDDVVSLILLSIAIALANLKEINIFYIIRSTSFYIVAWIIIFLVSVILIPRIFNRLLDKYAFELSLVVLFGLTIIMTALGFSPIIAAYIVGVSIAESNKSHILRKNTDTLLELFGSIFFVTIGAETNLINITLLGVILTLLLTLVAAIFKIVGIYPFAYLTTKNHKSSLSISLAMIPRGEIGLAVASIGLSYGLLNNDEFASIVLMALLTSIIGAILFKKTYIYLKNK
ncbi:MAG: cation:proton antiporter [Caldisphaera sp.]|nr:cation:proton antiporter [Caldisphaera sp.]